MRCTWCLRMSLRGCVRDKPLPSLPEGEGECGGRTAAYGERQTYIGYKTMEYFGNTLCVTVDEIVESGAMSKSCYDQQVARGKLIVMRRGGGKGRKALIALDSLPSLVKAAVVSLCPNGVEERLVKWVEKNYEWDPVALTYFNRTDLPCGVLSPEKRREYTINASVLNCCIRLSESAKDAQKLFGGRFNWDRMGRVLEILRDSVGHTLPCSSLRLRRKINEYRKGGYGILISGRFGNQHTRKLDERICRLLLSLACQPEQPYARTVWEMYCSWKSGKLDVYDVETGELFPVLGHANPDLSEKSVSEYLSRPDVRVLLSKAHLSPTSYMHEVMPHMHRHAPQWSLSKVSLDDRDLPRKVGDTKLRPKAYYAYDVLSQCVIGYAHSRVKTQELVVECFRSMFRLIDRMGWGCPVQLEVENHLMSQWKDSFLKAGEVFPLVRFCAPQNSQEKYAEVLNRSKKVSVEHRHHEGIGRFYARQWQNRVESQKVSDETNDSWEEKRYWTFEELVADDVRDIEAYNHALHPDQKRFPGKTRWDVLVEHLNPNLPVLDRGAWAPYIGEKVLTSVRRSSYCRVMGADWWLSGPEVLSLLSPGNMKVEAYVLETSPGPSQGGESVRPDVWIWQDGRLIDKLECVGTYNTAACERTEVDERIFVEQRKRIARFERWVKEHSAVRVGTVPTAAVPGVVADAGEDIGAPEGLASAEPQHTEKEDDGGHSYEEPAPQEGIDYGRRGIDDI